jgi:hypothetical protein
MPPETFRSVGSREVVALVITLRELAVAVEHLDATRGGPFGRPGGVNAVTPNGYSPLIKAALDVRFSGGESRRSDIWLDRVGRCS